MPVNVEKTADDARRRGVLICLVALMVMGVMSSLLAFNSTQVSCGIPAASADRNALNASDDRSLAEIERDYAHLLHSIRQRLNDGGRAVVVRSSMAELSTERMLDERAAAVSRQEGAPAFKCVGDPAVTPGKSTMVTLATASGERHFVVYVPTSYRTKRRVKIAGEQASSAGVYVPAPVLLLYHGLGDNCDSFLTATGFVPYAEKAAAVLVSLCGTAGFLGTAWNAGTCCGFRGDAPDELSFSLQVLEALGYAVPSDAVADAGEGVHLNLCTNPAKVAAAGFSNGAMLAEVLACRAPTVFRVAASVGGVVELRPGNDAGLAVCDAAVANHTQEAAFRPAVLMVHGDKDNMVPWNGRSFLGFPPMQKNVERWASRNNCDRSATDTTIRNNYFENVIYAQCGADAADRSARSGTVEIVRVLGGAHRWPERDGFSTTQHIAEFTQKAFGGWD